MNKIFSLGILVFTILILSIFQYFTDEIVSFFYKKTENFEINLQIAPIPSNKIIPEGYYVLDYNNMAKYPVGDIVTPLPSFGDVPDGYYIVNMNGKKYMAKVPDGFTASENKKSLIEITQKYNPDNYDRTYHNDMNDANTVPLSKSIFVQDKKGELKEMTYTPVQSLPTYYEPGSFQYGSTGYIPNYEDSVYLSKSTQLSTVTPLYKTSEMMGGFCNQLKTDPDKLEQTCNSIPSNQCASTTCCVLLGGDKCVSGDQYGPIYRANFTDKLLKNKDFYYYLGKCYGNCEKSINNIPLNVTFNENIKLNKDLPYTIYANVTGNARIIGNMIN